MTQEHFNYAVMNADYDVIRFNYDVMNASYDVMTFLSCGAWRVGNL